VEQPKAFLITFLRSKSDCFLFLFTKKEMQGALQNAQSHPRPSPPTISSLKIKSQF
jgi:hypothetical protein